MARPSSLPENPYLKARASWTEETFSTLRDQLQQAAEATERKLGETWDEAARAGYDLGFQAGVKETESELRAFYEQALTEQEAAASRALLEQAEELLAAHEAELAGYRERNRQEIERLGHEQEARLRELRETVRRDTEAELQHRFNSEMAQLERRVREETRREVEAELAAPLRRELERELQQRFSAELQAVEERVRRETERAMRAAFEAERQPDEPPMDEDRLREARADGYTQGLNESARRYEEAITRAAFEHREAVEAAYRKGFDEAGGQTEKELKAAYQEGYRQGLLEAGQEFAATASSSVPSPLLDEARRQAYENGYEDGRGVGLARGRRQAEAELSAKLQEATRVAYREGFLDGKRAVADAERSWAFGVLHLPPDASASEVKQHYKRLSMALHPDQNPQLADVFIKNLNRAKQLLDR